MSQTPMYNVSMRKYIVSLPELLCLLRRLEPQLGIQHNTTNIKNMASGISDRPMSVLPALTLSNSGNVILTCAF